MSFFQQAAGVRGRMKQGVVGGDVYADAANETISFINSNPQASQVDTLVVDTAANSTVYTYTVTTASGDIATISYTSDASATKAEISAGLKAAHDANPLAGSACSVADDGVDTLTFTARYPGIGYTLATSSANMTATPVTANGLAAAVPFGRACVSLGINAQQEKTGALAASALFSAQVITATITYVASAVLRCSVYEVRDNERHLIASQAEVMDTSLDASLDQLAVLLNAQLPANSVAVVSSPATATTLVFTAEVAGLEFDVEFSVTEASASVPSVSVAYTTGPDRTTSFHRAFVGISDYSRAEAATAIGASSASYRANGGVRATRKGAKWVESSQSPTDLSDVYVELGVAADNGQFFSTNSATRIQLSRRFRWIGSSLTSSDNIAALDLAA